MFKAAPRARRSVSPLVFLLRQCYNKPACQQLRGSVRHSSTLTGPLNSQDVAHEEVKDVAVIGGGITGLASAYFLSRAAPNARITLLEGGDRLGGWLHSEEVDVGNGKVLFEKGPRSLRPTRPNGILTLELVSFRKRRLQEEPALY